MRAHLAAIVLVVVAVFAGAGVVSAWQVLDNARSTTRASARHAAGVAAEAIAATIELGTAQVTAVAGNPAAVTLLEDPAACELAFALDLLPGSRLDLTTPAGTVACSSSEDHMGSDVHAGAPWLDELATSTGIVEVGATVDPAGAVTVAFAHAIRSASDAVLGAVVLVAPTGELTTRLTDAYGGRQQFDFAVIDAAGVVLSAPDATDVDTFDAGSSPLADHGHLAGSTRVPGTGWRVEAGLPPSVALESTRSVLLRGGLVGAAVLVVLLAALAVVNQRIASPLRRLTSAVSSTGSRVDDVLGSLRAPSEIILLAEELRSAMAAHEAYEHQLSHQALHDPLTGLPNRALLAERLGHSLEQARRNERLVTVLFLDLDRFKVVNDSLGHAVGDQVLTVAARRLGALLRPGDTLARFGGDEFVIVGEAFTDQAEVERFAERLLATIDEPIGVEGQTVRLSASIGIAVGNGSSKASDLVRDADTAMYLAKEAGRAQLAVFDTTLRDRVTERLTIETELRAALEQSQLRLVYQPKIDLDDGRTVGVEALLRWDHPTLGSVAPATFIPIAEETGLIVPIGSFVLGAACRQVATWCADGVDLPVAVNVSGRQLADPSLPSVVAAAIADAGIEADRLCLELTESLLLTDALRIAGMLQELRSLGVRISIDDFGTGYSSLAYLHRFPIDEIKIDQMFVHDLAVHDDQRTLVTAMVAMGHALGLDVVAEGVETPEQAHRLRAIGCRTAQGQLFASPQSAASLFSLIREPLFVV